MKKLKKAGIIFLIAITAVTTGGLTASVVKLKQKNCHISEIESKLESSARESSELTEEKNKLNSENEALSSERDKLSDELKTEKKKKSELEKENGKLKKEIEKLKAKRKAKSKAEAAVNSAASSAVSTVSKKPSGSKICYLTFDDGPSANTLKILDTLKKYNAKATFFVINTDNIAYVKNIKEAGHTIGLHSASHNYSQIYKSSQAYFSDLNKISSLVFSYTGTETHLIRFPGGSSNSVSRKYCKGIMTKLSAEVSQKGYYYYDWNVSSEDATANTVSSTKIVNSVLKGAEGKNSICVLMHDSAAKTTTADALPRIIEGLSERGFTFEALTADSPGFRHGITN